MLLIGTGGVARDLITTWEMDPSRRDDELHLFDNVNLDSDLLYDQYKIYHSFEEIEEYFDTIDKRFITCLANPIKRERVERQIKELGGQPAQFISYYGTVLHHKTPFGKGSILQTDSKISRDSVVGDGVFINAGVIIGHDCLINDYVSIGPGCRLLGDSEIGTYSYIGCNAVIMPGVKIGRKVRVGVGKVVKEDLPDNTKFM